MPTFRTAAAVAVLAVAAAGAAAQQCPEVLEHTCLPTSLPIIQELPAQTAAACCAACEGNEACVSWTLNKEQQKCHLRATFLQQQHKAECTSGHIPGRGPAPTPSPAPPPAGAKNVLLIMVDDLRPQLASYNVTVCGGARALHTPHLDSLAARSLVFRNAFCQYAVCSPSRNSFMSGRRPDSTLTYNFKDSFRSAPGGGAWLAMPEYFKDHGYNTSGAGKTYHAGHPPNFDQPRSWTLPYPGYDQGLGFCGDHCACNITDPKYFSDESYANITIDTLKSHKANGIGPWFVAVGFIRPHVDWSSPPEFWDYYPEDECGADVAVHKSVPPTAPKVAWVDGGYVDKKSGDVGPDYHFSPTDPVNDSVANFWRRGYYAAVSYMDSNVGKVLAAMDELGFTNNTVIAFMADHGYQLGEHSMWEKYTNWELAARVPMMLSVPWKPESHGRVTTALVENVDMYPTLAVAAGLPLPAMDCDNATKYPGGFNGTCVEGADNTPLLDNPHQPWKKAAFSQYARCSLNSSTGLYSRCSGSDRDTIEVMGYSVRTAQYRFTEWFKFNDQTLKPDFNSTVAMELYDHTQDTGDDFDAYDQVNLASNASFASVVAEHRQIVRSGWEAQRPPPAAVGLAGVENFPGDAR